MREEGQWVHVHPFQKKNQNIQLDFTSFTDENCFQIVKTSYLPGGFTLAPLPSPWARLGSAWDQKRSPDPSSSPFLQSPVAIPGNGPVQVFAKEHFCKKSIPS